MGTAESVAWFFLPSAEPSTLPVWQHYRHVPSVFLQSEAGSMPMQLLRPTYQPEGGAGAETCPLKAISLQQGQMQGRMQQQPPPSNPNEHQRQGVHAFFIAILLNARQLLLHPALLDWGRDTLLSPALPPISDPKLLQPVSYPAGR